MTSKSLETFDAFGLRTPYDPDSPTVILQTSATASRCPYFFKIMTPNRQCFPEIVKPELEGATIYICISPNGTYYGHAFLYNDYEIANMCVERSHRRKGYATRLIQYILQKHPDTVLHLWVKPSNLAAIQLYQKLGFYFTSDTRSNATRKMISL